MMPDVAITAHGNDDDGGDDVEPQRMLLSALAVSSGVFSVLSGKYEVVSISSGYLLQ
jgi:hypothetical protein